MKISIFLSALICTINTTQGQTQSDSLRSHPTKSTTIKIIVTSVMVADQDKALKFYTEKLGFIKKTEIPEFKWLTVVSPESPDGVELLLEPLKFQPAINLQKAMYEGGIPATTFGVTDIKKTYEKLEKAGVVFKLKPTDVGTTIIAMFDDTCGNLIQLSQK
jgi:predicted enzyme related to lactoylglutathione lyase